MSAKTFFAGAALLAGLAAMPAAHAESGDPAAGAKVFKKCRACHDVEGKNKIGPHLQGIVGRTVGSVEGFKYSSAMTEYAAEQPEWTEEALEAFLRKPKDVVKKTKMAFAGLKKDDDLANIIAYLRDPAAAK